MNAKYSDESASIFDISMRGVGVAATFAGVVAGVVLDFDLALGEASNAGFIDVTEDAERARIE